MRKCIRKLVDYAIKCNQGLSKRIKGLPQYEPEIWGEDWEWEPHIKKDSGGICGDTYLKLVKLTGKWKTRVNIDGSYSIHVEIIDEYKCRWISGNAIIIEAKLRETFNQCGCGECSD